MFSSIQVQNQLPAYIRGVGLKADAISWYSPPNFERYIEGLLTNKAYFRKGTIIRATPGSAELVLLGGRVSVEDFVSAYLIMNSANELQTGRQMFAEFKQWIDFRQTPNECMEEMQQLQQEGLDVSQSAYARGYDRIKTRLISNTDKLDIAIMDDGLQCITLDGETLLGWIFRRGQDWATHVDFDEPGSGGEEELDEFTVRAPPTVMDLDTSDEEF